MTRCVVVKVILDNNLPDDQFFLKVFMTKVRYSDFLTS